MFSLFAQFPAPVDARPEAILVGTSLLILAALLRRGLRHWSSGTGK